MITCKFCQAKLSRPNASKFVVTCDNCNVQFDSNNNKLFSITYYLNDPFYYALVMHLDTEITVLWVREPTEPFKGRPKPTVHLTTIYPDTDPKDALDLARRIDNMKVFS